MILPLPWSFDVVFSNFDVVEPDLLYLSNARAAEALTPQHVRGVPELVIEIGSPGTRRRDETVKGRLHERTGVSEYWVVERAADAGDILIMAFLPGLEVPLSRVFRA